MVDLNTLRGKLYPVKNTVSNEVVGCKTITDVRFLENYAGLAISLNESSDFILISFGECADLLDGNKQNALTVFKMIG